MNFILHKAFCKLAVQASGGIRNVASKGLGSMLCLVLDREATEDNLDNMSEFLLSKLQALSLLLVWNEDCLG